jgi:hypothetical protein
MVNCVHLMAHWTENQDCIHNCVSSLQVTEPERLQVESTVGIRFRSSGDREWPTAAE